MPSTFQRAIDRSFEKRKPKKNYFIIQQEKDHEKCLNSLMKTGFISIINGIDKYSGFKKALKKLVTHLYQFYYMYGNT